MTDETKVLHEFGEWQLVETATPEESGTYPDIRFRGEEVPELEGLYDGPILHEFACVVATLERVRKVALRAQEMHDALKSDRAAVREFVRAAMARSREAYRATGYFDPDARLSKALAALPAWAKEE